MKLNKAKIVRGKRIVTKKFKKIILTPVNTEHLKYINLNREPRGSSEKAAADFKKQCVTFEDNEAQTKWDDCAVPTAKPGGRVGYAVTNRNVIVVCKIQKVVCPSSRPVEWDIPEHSNRNVLCLSKPVCFLNYDKYCLDHGYGKSDSRRWHTLRKTDNRKLSSGYLRENGYCGNFRDAIDVFERR